MRLNRKYLILIPCLLLAPALLTAAGGKNKAAGSAGSAAGSAGSAAGSAGSAAGSAGSAAGSAGSAAGSATRKSARFASATNQNKSDNSGGKFAKIKKASEKALNVR